MALVLKTCSAHMHHYSSAIVYLVGWECWVSEIELKGGSG